MSILDHKLEPKPVRRIEMISGPGGRRRFSDGEKARIIEEALMPEAVVAAVARQNGLTPQQLFDPPPLEWSDLKYGLWHQGESEHAKEEAHA